MLTPHNLMTHIIFSCPATHVLLPLFFPQNLTAEPPMEWCNWVVGQEQSWADGPEKECRIREDVASVLPTTAAAGKSVKTHHPSQPIAIPFYGSLPPLWSYCSGPQIPELMSLHGSLAGMSPLWWEAQLVNVCWVTCWSFAVSLRHDYSGLAAAAALCAFFSPWIMILSYLMCCLPLDWLLFKYLFLQKWMMPNYHTPLCKEDF